MPLQRAHHIGRRRFAALLMALLLAACDGDDRRRFGITLEPPPTSIATGTTDIRFALLRTAGDNSQDVTLVYEGTDVLAGFPPDVPAPHWLTITPGPVTAHEARFTLTVNPLALDPGRHDTVLRFSAGFIPAGGTEADIKRVKTVDIPLRLTVLDLDVAPQLINTNFIKGNGNLTGLITIQSPSNLDWLATSDQPWLTLSPASGAGTSTVAYSVDPFVSGYGPQVGHLRVRHPDSGEFFTTTFEINVIPPDLKLVPESLVFSLDGSSPPEQYSQALSVTDRLNGNNPLVAASWSVSSIDVPWLAMTPLSGSSAPAVNATVSVRADQIGGLANGTHNGTITLAYTTDDGVARTRTLPVTLNLAM
jgi:hypothetical protein